MFLLWRQRDSAHPNRRVSHVFAVRWSGHSPGDQRFVFCRQMKNAVVATTANKGVAVSRSRAREVQSVYIAAKAQAAPILSGALLVLNCCLALVSAQAGVVFDDCQPTPDGGVTCNTRPTGNTLLDDEAARYGLFNEASPGWAEYDPYQGYDDMFGGNET
jgi:hypothetical protein